MPSSRGSSQLRDQTQVSHISGGFFTVWATTSSSRKKRNHAFLGDKNFREEKNDNRPLDKDIGRAVIEILHSVLASAAHILKLERYSTAPAQGWHANSWSVPYLKKKKKEILHSLHLQLKMRHKATEYTKYNASKRIHYSNSAIKVLAERWINYLTMHSCSTARRRTHINGYHQTTNMNTSTHSPHSIVASAPLLPA